MKRSSRPRPVAIGVDASASALYAAKRPVGCEVAR